MLALAGNLACRDITLNPDRVIALELSSTNPTVEQGDTVRLVAVPLNAAGKPVTGASVTWTVVDTGVTGLQLDPSGLVHGNSPDTALVQASADDLRSDPITLIVTAFPDTAAATGSARVVVSSADGQSGPLIVTVYDRDANGLLTGTLGKTVVYQVVQPANSTGFFLTVSDTVPGPDRRRIVTRTATGGQSAVVVRRKTGETPPDSVIVDATAQTSRGLTVAGTPVRFTVVFQ